MSILISLSLILLSALGAVTFLATAGAYASRRFNFNYSYLIGLSLTIYIVAGYFSCRFANLRMALFINLIIGFYDATAGWKLSQKVKPKTGFTKEQLSTITLSTNLKVMLIVSIGTALIGYTIA